MITSRNKKAGYLKYFGGLGRRLPPFGMLLGCLAAGFSHPVAAACLTGAHVHIVHLHLKRSNRDVTFNIPEGFDIQTFDDSFIIGFSYPDFSPRPVMPNMRQPSVRLVIHGGYVGQSGADHVLGQPDVKYDGVRNGVKLYRGELGKGFPVLYHAFADPQGNTVLFEDLGDIAVGYFYDHRLSNGVDLRGVVSKKIATPLPDFDADVSGFIGRLICVQ